MRFMMIVKATEESEAGALPEESDLAVMAAYNEELMKAGVLLAADGLHPSSKGARVHFSEAGKSVVDGPFTETKELIAGFWLIQARSREEALEWAKRAPNPHPGHDTHIEVRQVYELEDFVEGEALDRHRRQRAELEAGRE